MSNKTPFEIRLDILHLAKDYMDKIQSSSVEFATAALVTANQYNSMTAEQIKAMMPAPYTIEDLTKKATELYTFVTTK